MIQFWRRVLFPCRFATNAISLAPGCAVKRKISLKGRFAIRIQEIETPSDFTIGERGVD